MKRILALILSAVLMLSISVPAYATGDENIDGGGGNMGSGTSTSYWNPGMDGVRVSVINVDSHAVVGNVIDLTNKTPASGVIHFGKVSKLSYNAGRSLSPVVGNYSYINPSQSLPRIISSGSYPASIDAIRSYFTDEQVIRAIAGYVGMDFDSVMECSLDITGTLRAQEHGHQPLVFDNHGQDTRFCGPVKSAQTVSATFGMGGNSLLTLSRLKGLARSVSLRSNEGSDR